MVKKISPNSFIARLTAAQREELFFALSDGLGYRQALGKIRAWMQANDEAGLNGDKAGREIRMSAISVLSKWYRNAVAQRRYERAKEAAAVALAHAPADFEEQARRALGHARYLATLEGLAVSDIASLERNELARERLAFDREKHADQQRRDAVLEQAQKLLDQAKGNAGENLQFQIDLALAEIHHMKHGCYPDGYDELLASKGYRRRLEDEADASGEEV